MTRNCFEDIVSILHFNDNEKVAAEGQNGHDKLHKIQLLVDHYKKMFSNSVIPATYQANNEMMVQFKGYHGLKMYKPKKLVKWWYKIWSCAGISGYVYGFEVLGGKDAKGPPRNVQLLYQFSESDNVVLHLIKDLEKDKHKVFFDNLFVSPELMIQLRHQGIFAVGTLRSHGSRGCPIPAEWKMRKEGCGTICEFVEKDHNLVICGWYDNCRVLIISYFARKNPVSETNHYNHKNHKDLKVPHPASVEICNRYMGGMVKARYISCTSPSTARRCIPQNGIAESLSICFHWLLSIHFSYTTNLEVPTLY